MPGPIEDRLSLLRACPVNISPIYAVYRGDGGLAPFLDALGNRPPDARFTDDTGTLHRLWAVNLPAEIDVLRDALAPGPLVIADGHHRYETALAYHAEQDGTPGGHDAVMCFCVDADAEDLVVFPFHRAVKAPARPHEVRQRLLERFGGKVLHGEATDALDNAGSSHPMAFVLQDDDIFVDVSAEDVTAKLGTRSEAWRSLDVVALHEVVLPQLFPEGMHDLVFTKEPTEVARLVRDEGWAAGVLLRPPHAADVFEVARSGERMPQKASYFWPKALTGLVFRTLR
jgi:uncharacterized protein (DUF1015 family)